MHCTDPVPGAATARLASRRALALALACSALLAGCASRVPAPAPPPPAPRPPPRPLPAPAPAAPPAAPSPAPPESPAPREGGPLGPRVALPPAPPVRNWDEFKRMAATRMVQASPRGSYMSRPPPLLFGIPVLEVELNGDGSVRSIGVMRRPADERAQDTIALAMEAIRRGAPYGDVSRLPRPWRFIEVFLFNDQRQFKPRTLD